MSQTVILCEGYHDRAFWAGWLQHLGCVDPGLDPDIPAASAAGVATGLRLQDVEQVVRQFDAGAVTKPAGGEIEIDAGATRIALVRWETPDADGPGLPTQQTLERLTCTALIAAYPTRANAVQGWLQSRPNPPQPDVKEYSWSFMAGWYAEFGCEAFYSNLWKDQEVVQQLISRLFPTGAWQTAEALAA